MREEGGPAGEYVSIGGREPAFVPYALPPRLVWSPGLLNDLAEAARSLGVLEGFSHVSDFSQYMPGPRLLLSPLLQLEALSSSRIEGTVTTLEEILRALSGDRTDVASGTVEVLNYLDALELGMAALRRRPLNLDLVRELHRELLKSARGHDRTPGEYRQRQVYIGNPRVGRLSYVPPPPERLPGLLADWERFLLQDDNLPPLLKCALLHVQFEMIHPFSDGNGRTGRLIMSLYLVQRGYLSQPLLYLSGYLERNRAEYYTRLQAVSRRADWQGWTSFLLRGIAAQAQHTVEVCRNLIALRDSLRAALTQARVSATAMRLLDLLFENPYTSVPVAAQRLDVTYPTAQLALRSLERMGLVIEYTGRRRRNRRFRADGIIAAIRAEEEQVPGARADTE
ncbi:Fic family protein [bacterium]|nr:Fic family protein [bacterium]